MHARRRYSLDLMATTSATPRRMANAAATMNVLLAVHRTTGIPVRFSAPPEARSPPEGPMRGRIAIARRCFSLPFSPFVCFALSLALFHPRSFEERERERKRERSHQRHALCTQIYMLVSFQISALPPDLPYEELRICAPRASAKCKIKKKHAHKLKKKGKTTTRRANASSIHGSCVQHLHGRNHRATDAVDAARRGRTQHGAVLSLPQSLIIMTGEGGPVAEFGERARLAPISNSRGYRRPFLERGA